jgi:hypothetical protein
MLRNVDLIDEVKANEKHKADDKVLDIIDMQYPIQDDAKKWLLSLIKPFLLTLINEPKYDYTSLLPEEAKPLEK